MHGPFGVLTRHFVSAYVAPPMLSELGTDYLRRTLASLFAILLVIGLFLPRAYSKKYIDLGALLYREPYDRALQADTLLMITVPMLLIGLISVILAPMLFPDETDYRVLSPLPVTRAQLFVAKLAALLIVMGIGLLAINLMASFWFPLVTHGWRQRHPFGERVLAHVVASLGASTWMFTAVMAIQGLNLVLLPPAVQRRIGLALQAAMVVALLAAIPFVVRIPTMDVSQATVVTAPLIYLPPVWFLGIQQTLTAGSRAGGYAQVAGLVPPAFAITIAIVAITYVGLYRSAERLAQSTAVTSRILRRGHAGAGLLDARPIPAAVGAILRFTRLGLTRSRLHQFVFLLIVGVGVSLPKSRASLVPFTTPLLVGLTIAVALRMAFLLPLDRPAAWLFRITETGAQRRHLLDAVRYAFITAVVVPTTAVALAMQTTAIGPAAAVSVVLTVLAALALVEFVLVDWRRIPFTCSYLPGKRVLAYTVGVLFASYSVFVFIGAHLVRAGAAGPAGAAGIGALFLAIFVMFHRARRRSWGQVPLEFEDVDPMAARPLVLSGDDR